MPSSSDMNELLSKMKSYSERVKPLLEHCDSEEQTKISFINPFIEVLDHDVRDPRQVRFEYSVDVRLNKEKVDYAIFHEGQPTIFVEAKAVGIDLSSGSYLEQVRSYANQTHSVKFVALTNGVDWHWFKKEDRQFEGYRLEEIPFLTHNVLKPGTKELSFLINVCGRGMDVQSAEEQALETRLLTAFEDWLKKQLREDSLDDDFIALLTRKYVGKAQHRNLEKTRRLWVKSIKRFIEKKIEERLQLAQDSETAEQNVDASENSGSDLETIVDQGDEENGTTPSVPSREFITESGNVVLHTSQRARAWRPKEDATWRIEKKGNDLFVNVLRYLASRHDFGTLAYYQSISEPSRKFISNDPNVYGRYRRAIHVGNGYHVELNTSNGVKDGWLRDVAEKVLIQGEKCEPADLVEWWL
ncbi:MAG: type I restriction enzyme HsdR N-terminal domain-containing protein [Gammaproteobacteria bacterium]|nr:type I restriction enzyme HsdR N-terminal domain-containing protein [Gammaproteobacteria bacterium]